MKVAIIGAGNMGGAIARGLAQGTIIPASDVTVADPFSGSLETLQADYPEINVTTENPKAIKDADIVILAVKPWLIDQVVECGSFDSTASIGFYCRWCNFRTAGKECRSGTDHIPFDSQYCYFSVGKYDFDIQS